MEHAAFHRVLRQVFHRVDEAERGRAVAGVEVPRDHPAGPSAHARQDADVLLAVRGAPGDRLSDDAGGCAELPEYLAVFGVERLEGPVHRAVEDNVARRDERAAPHGEALVHAPALLRRDRIPGGELAAMTARTGLHRHIGADIGRARDVRGLVGDGVLTKVLVRNVEELSARRPRRGLPVLGTWRRRTDIAYRRARLRLGLRVVLQPSGFQVHAGRGCDMDEGRGGKYFAARAVHYVDVAVTLRPHERLDFLFLQDELHEHVLVDRVVVVQVVRAELIEPARLAGVGLARENAGGPFVVAGALLRIPRAGIAGAVIDEVEFRVVGDPAPRRAAAGLPGLGGPGLHAEIGALVARIERLEARADQHLLVRAGAVGAPEQLAALRIERREPAAHAELGAGIADEHLSLHHERRHGHRFPARDVAELRPPELLAALRVERDGMVVEGVEEKPPAVVEGAAVDNIAARDALRRRIGLRVELPLQAAAHVEREHRVRPRRDDEDRAAGDDGRRLVAAFDARREAPNFAQGPDVGGVDLGKPAVARGRVVLRRHPPFAVVLREREDR